jgi:hypothetical protein
MDQKLPKPLRLWPGVIAVVLVCVARFGVKAVVPGFKGFALGMQWSFAAAALVIVWWLFFSRVRWAERLIVFIMMILGLGAAWFLRHESMGPLWLFAYAVPFLCIALVAGAAATRRLPDSRRLAAMAAVVLFACGAWTLVRTDGISGAARDARRAATGSGRIGSRAAARRCDGSVSSGRGQPTSGSRTSRLARISGTGSR